MDAEGQVKFQFATNRPAGYFTVLCLFCGQQDWIYCQRTMYQLEELWRKYGKIGVYVGGWGGVGRCGCARTVYVGACLRCLHRFTGVTPLGGVSRVGGGWVGAAGQIKFPSRCTPPKKQEHRSIFGSVAEWGLLFWIFGRVNFCFFAENCVGGSKKKNSQNEGFYAKTIVPKMQFLAHGK